MNETPDTLRLYAHDEMGLAILAHADAWEQDLADTKVIQLRAFKLQRRVEELERRLTEARRIARIEDHAFRSSEMDAL